MLITDFHSKLKMLFVMFKCLRIVIKLNIVLDLSLLEIIDVIDTDKNMQ